MGPRDPSAAPRAPELLQQLEAAIEGLVYSSESDRPFRVFFRPVSQVTPVTARGFAASVGAAPEDPVEEWTLDRFFARHIELVEPVDAAAWQRLPRYDALKRLLAGLRGVRVIRIGRVEVRCFAIGLDAAGDLVGVETVAVET
jgi:hypothetical protein